MPNWPNSQALDARAQFDRVQKLDAQKLIPDSDADRARAAADNADAQVRAARAALQELERGTRAEQLAQGRAAVQAARAQSAGQRVLLDKLTLTAPRDGVVDNLPYRLGDQAPLVIMLVGEAPYARVYVPEALRAQVKVGSQARVRAQGVEQVWQGKVRMIRSAGERICRWPF